MENKLISIIVPVYNVEDFLDQSVGSILNQSYKNFELLLIDDGSTDRSGAMIDEYAKMDTRIKAFHKKNGGASDARNYGLCKANGEYIAFFDADDYAESNMYEDMYLQMIQNDADIVSCGYYKEAGLDITSMYTGYSNTTVLNRVEALRGLFLFDKISEGNWSKLFRKTLFEGVSYKVGIHTEDILILPFLISKADKIVCIPTAYYHYVIRQGSSSHVSRNKHMFDAIGTMDAIYKMIEEKYPTIIDEVYAYKTVWIIDTYRNAYNEGKFFEKELLDLRNTIKKEKNSINNNSYIDKTYKLKAIGVCNNVFGITEWILNSWFAIKSIGKR